MKKFIYIFLAAMMALGAISCNKDKNINKENSLFNESDLIGYWACTKDLDTGEQNPSYSFFASPDHHIKICDYGKVYEGSWAIEGNKLVLSGEDFNGWDATLKELDAKHLVWSANWGYENEYYLEAYTNISRILPGAWKNVGPDAWYVVTIDESGTSNWKKNGTEDAGTFDWCLDIEEGGGCVIICFGDENSTWSDKQIILEKSDDFLKVKSKTEATVTFERLGTGGWEVESENADEAGSSPLIYAWYYYKESNEGYDICFSDVLDFDNRKASNWAYVDLAKSLCGQEHSLTEDLETDSWNFYGSTKTMFFDNGGFSSGTIFLSIDEENKTAVFRMSGTKPNGTKIKINYEGPAERKDEYVGD